MAVRKSVLDGVVRRSRFSSGRNPAPHGQLQARNRVIMEVVGPDRQVKQRVVHEGNILLTYGLNRWVEMLASDAGGATGWMNYIGVGGDTTAAASTQAGIGTTFGTGTAGGATVARSDKGARTVEYQATFSDTGNARTIQEVALCQTNTYNVSGGARSVLGTASVAKGTGDTVNISYQVVAGTA